MHAGSSGRNFFTQIYRDVRTVRDKTLRRGRPPIAPPPTTTGAADRRDQPKQSASDERQDSPIDGADRESLFQDFTKWQLDRNLFGRP